MPEAPAPPIVQFKARPAPDITALKPDKVHSGNTGGPEPRQLTPVDDISLRKLLTNFAVYSGQSYVIQPVTLLWMNNDDEGHAFALQLGGILFNNWKGGSYSEVSKHFWQNAVGSSTKGVRIISNVRTYQVLAIEDLFAQIGIHAKVDVRGGNVQRINGIMVAIGTK